MSNREMPSGMPDRQPIPAPPVPMHWIDTVPVKSTDRPCTIQSLDLRVHVCGLYADITETLTIKNPNTRNLSANIAIPMPDRAVVCGYALDIDEQMIDGVVVPKEKARVVFETEQRIGADPGLVESVKGNVYRTRVYPIPSQETRTVQLRYVAPLLIVGGEAAFLDAPLPSEHVDERTIRIDVELLDCPAPELSGVGGMQFKESGVSWSAESQECDVEPDSSIRMVLPKLPQSFALLERDEKGIVWFSASEKAPDAAKDDAQSASHDAPGGPCDAPGAAKGGTPGGPCDAPDAAKDGTPGSPCDVPYISSITVLWDASGSRAAVDHSDEIELLRSYCEAGAVKSYRLMTFSDHVETEAFDSADALLERIGSLRYDGGSDFQALSHALADMPTSNANEACVLFTDGIDTLGCEPISFPAGRKILSIVSGTERDTESLRQSCGGLVFDLAAAPKGIEALARAMFCSNFLSGIEGEGIAEVLGIGSGVDGRFAVVGRLVAPSAAITFPDTGTEFVLKEDNARAGNTISHAWAAMRVAQLSPRSDENADELLKLGRRFGVVSPATSLLVLETLDQWLRYEIEPPRTWAKMRREWWRARRGMMRRASMEALADAHRADLERAWADLLEWWRRDYPLPELRRERVAAESFGDPSSTDAFPRVVYEEDTVVRESGVCLDTLGNSYAEMDFAAGAPAADACESCAPCEAPLPAGAPSAGGADRASGAGGANGADDGRAASSASVKVQPWMPDADYLAALDEALPDGIAAACEAYFDQRRAYASSPSFFVDCAGWFIANGDNAFGLRVLSNLAELRIEDAAFLRVMAWRLREAGELERALSVLRRVLKLHPEDSQSHRDVALVLDELARKAYGAGDETAARKYTEEAGSFYRTIALTPWARRAEAVALFAVEEYNVLRAWADAQAWEAEPQLESLGEELEGVLDCDMRVTLAWDADETDIDLHVTEPNGEEAYYGNRLTYNGGRVSEDITDGYGPELYEIRHAADGIYDIRAHYYASHQQTIFGPASCTLTVYTDWGRPAQKQQITSTRLDDEREMVPVGTVAYGNAAESETADGASTEEKANPIVKGSSAEDLLDEYGEPADGDPGRPDGRLIWDLPGGRKRMAWLANDKVDRIVERMPWGEEMVIVQ